MKQRESILKTLNPDQLTGIINNLNRRTEDLIQKMRQPNQTLEGRDALTARWQLMSSYRVSAALWRYEQVAR